MEEVKVIKVTIEVEDVYFRLGLKIIISDFFYRHGKHVFFVFNDSADLVFRSEDKYCSHSFLKEIVIKGGGMGEKIPLFL